MLGVIVWRDAAAKEAVIWCDDHAQLAYLKGRENLFDPLSWPQVGDLVQFSLVRKSDVRFARALRILAAGVLPHLPEALNAAAAAQIAPLVTTPRLRRVG